MNGHEKQLPFFIYGTLLPGQPNAYMWGERIVTQDKAILTPGRLYDLGDYPILVDMADGLVHGLVVTVRAAEYDTMLAELDMLEGCIPDRPDESEYMRVMRKVQLENGPAVAAWVYIAPPHFTPTLPMVPDGDWLAHVQYKQSRSDAWWQAFRQRLSTTQQQSAQQNTDES